MGSCPKFIPFFLFFWAKALKKIGKESHHIFRCTLHEVLFAMCVVVPKKKSLRGYLKKKGSTGGGGSAPKMSRLRFFGWNGGGCEDELCVSCATGQIFPIHSSWVFSESDPNQNEYSPNTNQSPRRFGVNFAPKKDGGGLVRGIPHHPRKKMLGNIQV